MTVTGRQYGKGLMSSDRTDVWDAVGWDRPTVLGPDNTLRAVDHLVTYFADRAGHTGPRYTGALFTEIGGGGDRPAVATAVTAEDIVAVSTLSREIPAEHALQLMGLVSTPEGEAQTALWRGSREVPGIRDVPVDATEISRLLAELPVDVDLVDATDGDLEVAGRLWWEVRRRGLGQSRVSALLARKRPRLLPVIDRDVRRQLGHGRNRTDVLVSLRTVLQDATAGLPGQLADIRQLAVTESGGDARIGRLSDLRVLDIVLRMAERGSRQGS